MTVNENLFYLHKYSLNNVYKILKNQVPVLCKNEENKRNSKYACMDVQVSLRFVGVVCVCVCVYVFICACIK